MSYSSTLSVRNLFKKIEDEKKKQLKDALANSKAYIADRLRTEERYGGCSAKDHFRWLYNNEERENARHSMKMWIIEDRSSKNSFALRIKNTAKYAKLLYTDTPSPYHPNGYRSGAPHKRVKGEKNRFHDRTDQISAAKWKRCLKNFNDSIVNAIKRTIKK